MLRILQHCSFIRNFASYIPTSSMLNIAIIGGGAAGFFAAIAAKEKNPEAQVTIFEKNQKVLAKVAITGGGRCNLTNSFAEIKDLKQAYPRGDKLMKRLFKTFDYHDIYAWFENHGVKLITQEDQCVFPLSQNAQSIIDCLAYEARRLGVKTCTSHTLQLIQRAENGNFELYFQNHPSQVFNRVALTTGGSPKVSGLDHLRNLPHAIVQPVPSLFTFNITDTRLRALMGTVVAPVFLSIPSTKMRSEGALLLTHWGMSGPATLKLSSYAARMVSEKEYKFPISVNWIHETNVNEVGERLSTIVILNSQKQLSSIRPYDLPSRLWLYLIDRMGIQATKKWSELSKKETNKLIETLTNDLYNVSGKGAWKEEFVTCGGISLSDINLNTLESKVYPHLFFAGELLDIDAITGGFNLQAAWTTGYVVGQNIALAE